MSTSSLCGRALLVGSLVLASAALGPFATNAAHGHAETPAEFQGPGVKGPGVLDLELNRERSSDLSHVEPAAFATALKNDTQRIFDFVRDRVAYEDYPGLLRGPRGTLLAMAGNSVDRAALLASMLQSSGRRVRFAAGRLPEVRAHALARAIWIKRPAGFPDAPNRRLDPRMETFSEKLRARVEFEYRVIQETLACAGVKAPETAPASSGRVEGPTHYWVQLEEQEKWVDLDPSFSDSAVGEAHAKIEQTSPDLPASLSTGIEVTIRLEEYTGDQPATRNLLQYSSTAAELSGISLFLVHVPENWQEPAASLSDSLSQAIESTGRIKPILVVGDRWLGGEPFRQKPPKTTGLSGVRNLLGGEGTRKDTPLATAEFLEIEITSADGHKEKIVRELFDLVGTGRRAAGTTFTAAEAKAATERSNDQTAACCDVFFTSGRIDAAHLARIGQEVGSATGTRPESAAGSAANEPLNISALLRKVNIALVVAADGMMPRLETGSGGTVVFYPDSPRIQIVDLKRSDDVEKFTIDLRRTRLLGRSDSQDARLAFDAQLLRGVFEGALERTLGEFLSGDTDKNASRSFSTSEFIERAHAGGLPLALLRSADLDQLEDVPQDGLARLKESLTERMNAICPKRPVAFGGTPRFAWWLLDRHSGEIVAMTDEGLHGKDTERTLIHVQAGPRGMLLCRFETFLVSAGGGTEIVREGVFLAVDEGHLIDLARFFYVFNNWSTVFARGG